MFDDALRQIPTEQVKIERYRAEREIAEAEEMKNVRRESMAVQ